MNLNYECGRVVFIFMRVVGKFCAYCTATNYPCFSVLSLQPIIFLSASKKMHESSTTSFLG